MWTDPTGSWRTETQWRAPYSVTEAQNSHFPKNSPVGWDNFMLLTQINQYLLLQSLFLFLLQRSALFWHSYPCRARLINRPERLEIICWKIKYERMWWIIDYCLLQIIEWDNFTFSIRICLNLWIFWFWWDVCLFLFLDADINSIKYLKQQKLHTETETWTFILSLRKKK